jgi:hypothetical protein
MSANLGHARAIASSFVIIATLIAVPSAEGQSTERARALAVDSALRTYRLPSLAESSARTDLPWSAFRKQAMTDAPRFVAVQAAAPRTAETLPECPMPVARDPNRPLVDVTVITTPRYACENPLR